MKKEIQILVEQQRKYFNQGNTLNIDKRIDALKKLKQCIIRRSDEIEQALYQDLSKSPFEAYETEIGLVIEELGYVIQHLKSWAKQKRVKTPWMHFPAKSMIVSEPYGVVLVMSPWNYPFQLSCVPLIGAIAAGNCVVLKPSEYSYHTSLILESILTECFDDEYVTVVRGGREENQSLLKQKFDFIFFTGGEVVGKTVMHAAAEHVTPVVLELGGKSPCIVDETAQIDLAARRLTWGKLLNSGQTCVAPDYLLVHESVALELIRSIEKYVQQFYGETPESNVDYPKIINDKHYERLKGLLKDNRVRFGGRYNDETLKIAPTCLEPISIDHLDFLGSDVMTNEIFGPILPVVTFKTMDQAKKFIQSRPKPLALYYFTTDALREKDLIQKVSFGGGCINDTVIHLSSPELPFGGVGASGMGAYHGKASFRTFSHEKSIMKKSNLMDVTFKYPPFKNVKTLARLMKLLK